MNVSPILSGIEQVFTVGKSAYNQQSAQNTPARASSDTVSISPEARVQFAEAQKSLSATQATSTEHASSSSSILPPELDNFIPDPDAPGSMSRVLPAPILGNDFGIYLETLGSSSAGVHLEEQTQKVQKATSLFYDAMEEFGFEGSAESFQSAAFREIYTNDKELANKINTRAEELMAAAGLI